MMSAPVQEDLRAEISAAVVDIIAGCANDTSGAGQMNGLLRSSLASTGFHLLGVPEHLGGSGGTLADVAVVADVIAYHCARAPFGEEAFLAGWMLTSAGLAVPEGVTVAALNEVTAERSGDVLRLSGAVDVPWGRHADHVVLLARCGDQDFEVALLPAATGPIVEAENIAGEPRDTLMLSAAEVPGDAHGPTTVVNGESLFRRGALLRAVQLAGASRAVLDQTLVHVGVREQFGRPLSKFQAVQQQLAALAAEVSAMQMAAGAAVLATEAAASDPELTPEAELAVAAAKATNSAAAHVVAGIGHQLHGALGYAQEHSLGAATTRLWSWREECGNEAEWEDRLAAAVCTQRSWWSSIAGATRDLDGTAGEPARRSS